ncbi:MAG: hypothetical protein ACYCZN_15235 [Candidatus Dormibacteria bacterium]
MWSELRKGRLRACRVSARVTRIMATDVQIWLERAAQGPEVAAVTPQHGRRAR